MLSISTSLAFTVFIGCNNFKTDAIMAQTERVQMKVMRLGLLRPLKLPTLQSNL